MANTPMHLIADVLFARNTAVKTQSRVVLVVPPKAVDSILPVFVGQASGEDLMGGRMIRFEDGGELVLAPADANPEELSPFLALFTAWDGKVGTDARQLMAGWRDQADRVIRTAA
jgi:hypothetical protein